MTGTEAAPARGCFLSEGGPLARDDWKHDEEMWDEKEEEKKPSLEKQCPRCLHWLPRETPFCSWCGKVFEDRDGS
jgi:hypothetical protein